jgi:hypothetical protein
MRHVAIQEELHDRGTLPAEIRQRIERMRCALIDMQLGARAGTDQRTGG